MIPQLRKRVHAIERHSSPTGPCTTCGGKGHLVVRWTDLPSELGGLGIKDHGSPCPTCGRGHHHQRRHDRPDHVQGRPTPA